MGSFGGALWGGNPFAGTAGTFPNSNQVTPQTIFDLSRSLLVGNPNNTAVFSNDYLYPYFNLAYPELYQIMAQVQTPRVRREFYYLVPAYTSILNPLSIGVVDLDEPIFVSERVATAIQIATTGSNTPVLVTTSAPHGLGNNDDITIGEVIGSQAPWGRWFVTVVDAMNFTLNGSTGDGNSGTGGNLYTSSAVFQPVRMIDTLTDRFPTGRLIDCAWEESLFKFRGATLPAQIRVMYWANGNPPQNPATPLNIEGCSSYLTYRTSQKAAESKGFYPLSDRFGRQAVGASGEADGSGGLLRSFLNVQVLGMQRTTWRKQPFRDNLAFGWYEGDYIYGSQSGAAPPFPNTGGMTVREAYYAVPMVNGMANLDLDQGNIQAVSLVQDTVILNPSGNGVNFSVVLEQDVTGGHAVTFGDRFLGVDPTEFSGTGVAGMTRTILQFAIRPDRTIIFIGVTYGPAPY